MLLYAESWISAGSIQKELKKPQTFRTLCKLLSCEKVGYSHFQLSMKSICKSIFNVPENAELMNLLAEKISIHEQRAVVL